MEHNRQIASPERQMEVVVSLSSLIVKTEEVKHQAAKESLFCGAVSAGLISAGILLAKNETVPLVDRYNDVLAGTSVVTGLGVAALSAVFALEWSQARKFIKNTRSQLALDVDEC